MSFDARCKELGVELPRAPKPLATYIPAVRVGDLLFLSGVLPSHDGQLTCVGKVGRDVTIEEATVGARLSVLNALAIVREEIGTLDRLRRIVRLVGYVASAPGFTDQPKVMNGASDLLLQLFGDAGRHARVAVGAAELPRNASVELELIVQIT